MRITERDIKRAITRKRDERIAFDSGFSSLREKHRIGFEARAIKYFDIGRVARNSIRWRRTFRAPLFRSPKQNRMEGGKNGCDNRVVHRRPLISPPFPSYPFEFTRRDASEIVQFFRHATTHASATQLHSTTVRARAFWVICELYSWHCSHRFAKPAPLIQITGIDIRETDERNTRIIVKSSITPKSINNSMVFPPCLYFPATNGNSLVTFTSAVIVEETSFDSSKRIVVWVILFI